MKNTLQLLVAKHKGAGRFAVTKRVDEHGNSNWAVMSVLVKKPVYINLTQTEAVVLAGLCNLTDDPDPSTLQPFIDELLPEFELKS